MATLMSPTQSVCVTCEDRDMPKDKGRCRDCWKIGLWQEICIERDISNPDVNILETEHLVAS